MTRSSTLPVSLLMFLPANCVPPTSLSPTRDAQVVLIGDDSHMHGTYEFYAHCDNNNMTKRLIEEKGFTAVARPINR